MDFIKTKERKKEQRGNEQNLRGASVQHRTSIYTQLQLCSVKLRGKIKFKVRTTNDAEQNRDVVFAIMRTSQQKRTQKRNEQNLKHINCVYSFLRYLVS